VPPTDQPSQALVVGVSDYRYLSKLRPTRDAAGVRDVLASPDCCAYPPEQVEVLEESDATRDNIVGALEALGERAKAPGSRTFFYFSGHGGRGSDGSSYILPKVESSEAVERLAGALPGLPLFLMIETALGVLEARSVARRPAVRGLFFGAADYRESLRAGRSPDESELLYARASILHAARASGIEAFDTPWFEYMDLEGLEASAHRARLLGFDGKTAIHPSQVPTLNRVFSPTPEEIERARGIVEVMEKALAEGRNVATLGNEMVEALHLSEARRVLARARP